MRRDFRKLVKEIMEELEADGILRRTGEFRPSPITGAMQPVYVCVPDNELSDEARAKLCEGLGAVQ